jgi:4-carboxymuconolactone decarboxylase
VARHFNSELEWAIHEPIARQQGLSVAIIDGLFAGKSSMDGDAEMQIVHRYVTELLETNRVSAMTFQEAVDASGEATVVELTVLMGLATQRADCSHSKTNTLRATSPDPMASKAALTSSSG